MSQDNSQLPLSFENRMDAPHLSDGEIALRDQFVAEFMLDFNEFQACLRCGMQASFAVELSKKLMACSYVQKEIARLRRTAALDPEAQAAEDKAMIESTYREAMQKGPYQSRIAAARGLAELKGLVRKDAGEDAQQSLVDALRGFAQSAPV